MSNKVFEIKDDMSPQVTVRLMEANNLQDKVDKLVACVTKFNNNEVDEESFLDEFDDIFNGYK
jgi:hypothetical protein